MKKFSLYIISGLGTDERVFRNIHFPEFVDVHFVKWKKPLRKESLDEYIDRLLKEFDLSKPIVLFGLSFGGVVVQEMAKKINPLETIIISSLSSSKEMPRLFRLYGNLKLYYVTPFRLLKLMHFAFNRILSAQRSEDKKLISEILQDADVALVKWSTKQILAWRSEKPPENFFRIHGDNDKLLPLKNNNADVIIKGGGHLMVYNRTKEVENILNEELEKIAEKI